MTDVDSELYKNQTEIKNIIAKFQEFLLQKNADYGDSALNPLGIFSKHVVSSQKQSTNNILIRIDDKLSRIKNADSISIDDIIDLTGYLILLMVSKEWKDFFIHNGI